MERLSMDKIRIFLTFDDLAERGIQKEDMWREIPKVSELFSEMMEQAYAELGFDASGPLAVEVFQQLPAQGMVVIVTRGRVHPSSDTLDEEEAEDVYEMEVTLEQSDVISYAFQDFEYVLKAAHVASRIGLSEGTLYSYKDRWILQIDPEEMDETLVKALIAVLSEYGDATSVTTAVLDEYGKQVIAESAIQTLCEHFHS
jgi:adapter protein MecA 1/2